MRISVITITCRENPRLADMYKTLAASLARAKEGVSLEWIIVDERTRDRFDLAPDSDRFRIRYAAPLPSPYRQGGDKAPAHNSARNAGLELVTGNYIVFLNDCTLVTQDWISVAADIAAQAQGWRCKAFIQHDMAVPANGIVRMKDHHDRLRPVPPTTVAGACWGAPRTAFEAIGGFDLAYDGEDKGHDLDAAIRLARIGVQFVGTERAFCVRLRRTKTKTEISTRKEVFNGKRNLRLIQELNADRDRITPRDPAKAAEAALAQAAAPVVPPAPNRPGARADRRNINFPQPPRGAPARVQPVPRVARAAAPPAPVPSVPGGGDDQGAIDAHDVVTNGAGEQLPPDMSGQDFAEHDLTDGLDDLA